MYAGKKALVKVSGDPLVLTDEATTSTDDQNYQITNADKRILPLNATITVEEDGVTTAESYTLNRLSGTVTFNSIDAARGVVTVSGQYLPLSIAAECHEWSFTINGENIDVTRFQDDWNRRKQGLKSGEGSLSRWWDTDTYFADALIAGDPVVIELYAQDDLNPDRVFAMLNSDEMSAAVDGAVDDSVSFESTDELLAAYVS